jgi:hypothetical protein
MVVDRGVEVIPWIDLDMHFNPHCLFIVIGQARPKRNGMFHQLGGAAVGLGTIPMLGQSTLMIRVSDHNSLDRGAVLGTKWSVSQITSQLGPISEMESVSINKTAARMVAGQLTV